MELILLFEQFDGMPLCIVFNLVIELSQNLILEQLILHVSFWIITLFLHQLIPQVFCCLIQVNQLFKHQNHNRVYCQEFRP